MMLDYTSRRVFSSVSFRGPCVRFTLAAKHDYSRLDHCPVEEEKIERRRKRNKKRNSEDFLRATVIKM